MTVFEGTLTKGKKYVLTGGGGLMNEFSVVEFVRWITKGRPGETIDDAPQVVVKWKVAGGGVQEFSPYLYSWQIGDLDGDAAKLPLGKYVFTGSGEIRDASKAGMFGTIYDMPVVMVRTADRWKRVQRRRA